MPVLALVEETNQNPHIQGAGFQIVFDKTSGTIAAYQAAGRSLLVRGPVENYYRAPTDVDLLMGNPPASIHKWRDAGIDRLQRTVTGLAAVQVHPWLVEIRVTSRLHAPDIPPQHGTGIDSQVTYRIFGSGDIVLEDEVLVGRRLPHLPRIGLELVLPPGFETMTWYGRGPHENYIDRKLGAALGRYSSSVDDQFTPYVYTSESGGKEDVRWLTLTGADGAGIFIAGLAPLHIDALHYKIKDLEQAGHPYELTRCDETILHVDGWHMGVGGDDGWWASVHPEYLIHPGRYHFGLRLRPIMAQDDPQALARTAIEGVV